MVIVSLLFPYLITLKSTPHPLEAVPGAGPRPGEEQSCPTCDISEGEADGEVPRGIWVRKTWACCRERSGMETDQRPRRETRKRVVSFTAPPHLSSQGSDPWKSRLAFSLHAHTPLPSGTQSPLHTHRRRCAG